LKEKKGGQWPPIMRWNACTNKYVAYSDVQTQEACNKDDNYHYADDVENIHCVLRSRHARFQYESAGA
jgi:regulator of sigma D